MTRTFSKIQIWILMAVSAVIISSCATSNQMSSTKAAADKAFTEGDMKTALAGYEKVIAGYENSGKSKECDVYTKAATAALNIGDIDKAAKYFEKARYTASENAGTYWGMATCYRKIDNLSKEMLALQDYKEKYPQGDKMDNVNLRLFEIYTQTENWEQALNIWPQIKNSADTSSKIITDYFVINQALKNNKVCDSLANVMLKTDKNNIPALEWIAKKHYRKAEDLYQKEMKAYNKHKTRKQYARLLKALDKVTADFKTSLKYFKKLYSLQPMPEYARYLSNIYNRLDDKAKAEYYRKLAKR